MSDRRYDDKEVAAIFRSAAEGLPAPQQSASREDGLTLADLQSIAREVGISSDAVAQAAGALDVHGGSSQRKLLGLPIGVARTVELDRRLTDEEWERLVVRLREVFDAQGRTRSEGSLRQWSNGNLRVALEPTETGQRVRFRTVNGRAQTAITMGLVELGATATAWLATAVGGNLVHAGSSIAILGIVGLGTLAIGTIRLPGWARLRGRQMESLAAQLVRPPALPEPRSAEPPTE